MITHTGKKIENKAQSVANGISQKKTSEELSFQFKNNRPEAIAQRRFQEIVNNSSQSKQAVQLKSNVYPHTNHTHSGSKRGKHLDSTVIQRFLDPVTDQEIEIDTLTPVLVNHYIEMEREGKLQLETHDFIRLYAKKLGIPVEELGQHQVEIDARELHQMTQTPIAEMDQEEVSLLIQNEREGKLKLSTQEFIELYQRDLDLHSKQNVVYIFLNRFPIIRIFIPVAQGTGHQSASMALVERIKALGYRGRIQIIYQEGFSRLAEEKAKGVDNRSKLGLLIPGFDPQKGPEAVQEIDALGFEVMSEGQFTKLKEGDDPRAAQVPLGFTGAIDDRHPELKDKSKTIPEQLGVKHFQQFQPLDWHPDDGRRGVRTAGNPDIAPSVSLETSRLGYVYPAIKPPGMSDDAFFMQELHDNPGFKGEIQAVKQILAAPGGRMAVHSMAVYGATTGVHSQQAVVSMIALVEGIMHAQDKAKMEKGVVIPFIGSLADPAKYAHEEDPGSRAKAIQQEDDSHFGKIQAETNDKRVKIVTVGADFEVAIKAIQEVQKNEVLIIQFPKKLPKKVFDFLFARTTLPNASEGANTVDKDRQRKGAYLRVGKSAGKDYPGRDQIGPHGVEHDVNIDEQAAKSTRISELFKAEVYGRLKEAYQSNEPVKYFFELYQLDLEVYLPPDDRLTQYGSDKKQIEGVSITKKTVKIKGLPKPIQTPKLLHDMAIANPPGSFLGEFILESMNPESPLGRYFSRVKHFSQTHDQVQIGIAEIERILNTQ
ncbi:MAG: hypothetical protein KDD99_14320 [Bacteroidetes bacterium]|nr:hypothetical protein [Bacteroidota bacterium]